MLAEALAWLCTPASLAARRSGLLAESIAISARHRRCRQAWAAHLMATRQALLDSARAAPSRRLAVVLGSGPLLDVPLAELAGLFDRVWLVDMVHPWRARLAARRHINVRLVERDLAMPTGSGSDAWLADMADLDWLASVNLLSQLDRRLGHHPEDRPVPRPLAAAHLAWLAGLPTRACLVTDLVQWHQDNHGDRHLMLDLRPALADWLIESEWRWDIAPLGELAGGGCTWHQVAHLMRAKT